MDLSDNFLGTPHFYPLIWSEFHFPYWGCRWSAPFSDPAAGLSFLIKPRASGSQTTCWKTTCVWTIGQTTSPTNSVTVDPLEMNIWHTCHVWIIYIRIYQKWESCVSNDQNSHFIFRALVEYPSGQLSRQMMGSSFHGPTVNDGEYGELSQGWRILKDFDVYIPVDIAFLRVKLLPLGWVRLKTTTF